MDTFAHAVSKFSMKCTCWQCSTEAATGATDVDDANVHTHEQIARSRSSWRMPVKRPCCMVRRWCLWVVTEALV